MEEYRIVMTDSTVLWVSADEVFSWIISTYEGDDKPDAYEWADAYFAWLVLPDDDECYFDCLVWALERLIDEYYS